MNPNSIDRHPATLTNADFAHAWADLKQRLTRAIDELGNLFRSANGEDETRLAWKREAVNNAYDAWERLNDSVIRADLNYNQAWVRFTDQVSYLYNVSDSHPGYYEGVGLALSYQRGYGEGIDAPIIVNPHIEG